MAVAQSTKFAAYICLFGAVWRINNSGWPGLNASPIVKYSNREIM